MDAHDQTVSLIRINRIMFGLSLVGILIALYVTQSFLRQTSIVCVNTGCETVRKSASSYLLGSIPVPSVGLVGYTVLATLAFFRTADILKKKNLLHGMLGMAAFGVLFVSWFTYTEAFVIKAFCTWCVISAANMVVIFLLVIRSIKLQKGTPS